MHHQIEATMKSRSDKLAVLIDGPNLHAAAKSLGGLANATPGTPTITGTLTDTDENPA